MDTGTSDLTQKQRIAWYTDGTRGPDGLTDNERQLLAELRRIGYEIASEGRYARYIRRGAA